MDAIDGMTAELTSHGFVVSATPQDGGVLVAIGEEGDVEQRWFSAEDLGEAPGWMRQATIWKYPGSAYARASGSSEA